MRFSMTGQEKGDLLIHVTTWASLTVYGINADEKQQQRYLLGKNCVYVPNLPTCYNEGIKIQTGYQISKTRDKGSNLQSYVYWVRNWNNSVKKHKRVKTKVLSTLNNYVQEIKISMVG